MARLVEYFKEVDMRCTHPGLTWLARKKKIDPQTLGNGDYLLFVNRAQTMCKLLGANNVLVHLRSEHGRLDFRVLKHLPSNFSGQTFSYDAALKKVIESDFRKRGKNR